MDTALLDKTGTLTLGQPSLIGEYKTQNLQYAAALASYSTHPLSQAIIRNYNGEILPAQKMKEYPGKGLEAEIDGTKIRMGSRVWCGDLKAQSDDNAMELWLAVDGRKPVRFIFEDVLRKDAAATVSALEKAHINAVMVTGDRETVAKHIAAQCGIKTYYAVQTPPQKYDILEQEKALGHTVLMVGDGLNDAPVLVGAHVSMAPGSAIDMAQNAADIVFMGDKLSPVSDTYQIAMQTQKLVKQNFALAILYNCIAIPFALAGLVTPLGAALAMSGSSLIVIANSFRLKLFA